MIRCFIVGCPRSGTTLLQALLAAHPKVCSLPESHFFRRSFRGKRAFLLRGFHASAVLRSWLQRIGLQEYVSRVPKLTPFRNPVVKAFVRIMDEVALRQGAICWVEKTPGHIFVIEEIEKRVLNARFIHIIRDGRAVVASLCDAKRLYPDAKFWLGHLEKSVSLWNRAILKSAQCMGKTNHFFVSYEALTTNPKGELNAICRFLGLEFEDLEKYYSVLSESEREYVEKHLIEIPESLRRAMQHE